MKAKRIVIAVDFTEPSLKTLSQIKELELHQEAEIHLVNIFEYNSFNVDFLPLPTPKKEDFALIQKALSEKLVSLKSRLGLEQHNVVARGLVSENARQEFLQYADDVGADLLIAASEEKPGFRGLFEGSFTSFLSKFSRQNVLVLRPRH
jgi:nucleotide-binding universal stress UspA family protein